MVTDGWRVMPVEAVNDGDGSREDLCGRLIFFSTAPVQEIMRARSIRGAPKNFGSQSDGLVYRDFITVGLLVRSLRSTEDARRRASAQSG